MSVSEVTDQTFDREVLQSTLPVIVVLWAEWCAPCGQISPIIHDLATRYGDRVKIVKMNIDENPRTPATYQVRSIPLVLAIRNGQVVGQILGARPKPAFEELVKTLL